MIPQPAILLVKSADFRANSALAAASWWCSRPATLLPFSLSACQPASHGALINPALKSNIEATDTVTYTYTYTYTYTTPLNAAIAEASALRRRPSLIVPTGVV